MLQDGSSLAWRTATCNSFQCRDVELVMPSWQIPEVPGDLVSLCEEHGKHELYGAVALRVQLSGRVCEAPYFEPSRKERTEGGKDPGTVIFHPSISYVFF